MSTPVRVLIVEDSEDDAMLVARVLEQEEYDLTWERVDTREAMSEALESQEWDLVIADYAMPHFSGLDALKQVQENGMDLPFIIVSGKVGELVAVEAMRAGAHDYVMKSSLSRLGPAVERELQEATHRQQRKRAENALDESEQSFRTLFDSAVDAIFLADPQTGMLLDANQAATTLTGHTHAELVHMHQAELHPPEKVEHYKQMFARHIEQGRVAEFEAEVIRKGDSTVQVYISAALTDIAGRQVLQGRFVDITERKRAEEERELLEQQLFQAQKLEALGTLAGGVAHDFNNLLTGIIGMTELALKDTEPDSQVFHYISGIPEQGKRGAELIASLMAFSRRAASELQPLALLPLAKETVTVLKRTIPEDVTVQMLWPEQLPVVNADPTQMQQVILNLATNARDAMPAGGELTIEVGEASLDEEYCRHYAEARPGDYVCLSVRDTGIGMSPEVQDRIFEPFFTTKETGEGTGLGLAMVYGIVKNHNGFVHVCSERGTGTEFGIYLPIAEEQTCGDDEDMAEDIPRGEETLLLVEDDSTVLSVGRGMLESLGYTVLTARDGEEALDVYGTRPGEIDLVLTDMTMPKMGGGELYEALVQMNPMAKVMLISGYGLKEDVSALQARGLQGFVKKPFNTEGLGKAVRECLDSQT